MEEKRIKEWLVLLIYIGAVVAVGSFAVNQALEFRYRSEFLQAPCKLCLELNPEISPTCFERRVPIFPDGNGGWRFTNGSIYEEGQTILGDSFKATPSLEQTEEAINNLKTNS